MSTENSLELQDVIIKRDDGIPTPNRIKIREREIQLQERKSKLYWQCCSGSKMTPEFIKYIVSVFFSATILAFSISMIATSDDNKEIYFNLISFIVGVYIKGPSLNSKK